MNNYLGFDTSNYTTSAAVFCGDKTVFSEKKLLPVKKGERGLRQSDAVFHHTNSMPMIVENLFSHFGGKISAVGCSNKPRDIENSYMPCFSVGKNTAYSISKAMGIPYYEFSHQQGHIAAALYSLYRFELFEKEFIAFHLSGGTTEALLVKPNKEKIISTSLIAQSLDLNAGQAIDRIGVLLGYDFPCGKEIENSALKSDKKFNINIKLFGDDCSLSGLENKCKKMIEQNESKEDISLFCLEYIKLTLSKMTENLIKKYGDLPLVFAGGVMSNSIIRQYIEEKYDGLFAKPEFSRDNAVGISVLTYLKENNK